MMMVLKQRDKKNNEGTQNNNTSLSAGIKSWWNETILNFRTLWKDVIRVIYTFKKSIHFIGRRQNV